MGVGKVLGSWGDGEMGYWIIWSGNIVWMHDCMIARLHGNMDV
jgi:hypothetical protein